ncbi:MAG: LacI family DNA-binding transcriptional regulator [Spirochaetaceae bacterium]|jgi:LacI family transcriptional regulator|nr:LacI family DNA-binding transcriptional regulator [Spirochaetaceae bacterium]
MPPRIVDIAKAAGVSPSAVSLALNNKTGVSIEVKRKIAAIAADMGYKAVGENPSWLSNKAVTIKLLKIAKHGRIINEHHNAFITAYMEGIELGTKKRNYKLEVSFFDRVPVKEIVEAQAGIAADGFIVLGTELDAEDLACFSALSRPIVFVDAYSPMLAYDCIDMDNVDGVFKAVEHLYAAGHRNIGMVKSSVETRNFKMREWGFREAMEFFFLPVPERNIVSVDPDFEQSILDMGKYLDKTACGPTAFFCLNDNLAYGCMRALREHAITIPGDISVIGFDDLPSSSLTEPPLTTIRVSTRQIGKAALEKLAERISGGMEDPPVNIFVSGKLIPRGSVKNLA